LIDKVAKLLDDWRVGYTIKDGLLAVKRSKWKVAFPQINEELAYLLGILYGDGCLTKPQLRKTGGYRRKIVISFSSKEKERAEYICSIFRKHFHCEPRFTDWKARGKKDWIEVVINSTALYAYFCVLGFPIGEKYGKLELPPIIQKRDLFKHFLMGLIDSDGHIIENRRLTIVQKDARFLAQVREASFRYLGIQFSSPKPNSKTLNGKTCTWYYIYICNKNISKNSFDWLENGRGLKTQVIVNHGRSSSVAERGTHSLIGSCEC
jgi:hypothetical protein